MDFKAKRTDFSIIHLVISLALAGGIYYGFATGIFGLLIGLSYFIAIMLSKWILTKYQVEEGVLTYNNGYKKNNIPTDNIKSVSAVRSIWQNHAWPAPARNGLMIRYNEYDDLFVVPKQEQRFIEALLDQNPDIVVKP